MPQKGLKMGSFHPFVHPKWSRMRLGPIWTHAFLTHFSPIVGPKTAHFQGILGFSEDQNGPPQAQNGPKTLVLVSHMV